MSLIEDVVHRIEELSEKGNRDAVSHWCDRLNQLLEVKEELANGEVREVVPIEEAVRRNIDRRKKKEIKFRVGSIANEVSSDMGLDRGRVEEVVRDVLDREYDVVETGNRWFEFRG